MSEKRTLDNIPGFEVKRDESLHAQAVYNPDENVPLQKLEYFNNAGIGSDDAENIKKLIDKVNDDRRILINFAQDAVYPTNANKGDEGIFEESFQWACTGKEYRNRGLGDGIAFFLKRGITVEIEDAPYSAADLDKIVTYWKSQ